jgi:hypothetical protein
LEDAKVSIARLYKDAPPGATHPPTAPIYHQKEFHCLPPLKVYDEKGKHEVEKIRVGPTEVALTNVDKGPENWWKNYEINSIVKLIVK